MTLFLTVVHVVVCFTLILVILLQAGRGQGLTGASFGGGNVQSLFGTRAADFMTKATTVAAICFLLTSIGLDLLEVNKSKSLLQFSQQKEATIDMAAVQKALEAVQSQEGGEVSQVASEAVEEEATQKASDAAETAAEMTTEPSAP